MQRPENAGRGSSKPEAKHSAELLNAVVAVFLIGVENGFGVGTGPEGVAGSLQSFCQVPIVVDLAVEDDSRRAVLVEDRLPAAAQVDDTEPPVAKPHPALHEIARVVGPAMSE
jgi:hypothetical protein